MPNPKTVDDFVTGIIARELDPAQIETNELQDLIACLEARQNPVCADACLDLIANAARALSVAKQGQNHFHPDCEPGSATYDNVLRLVELVVPDGERVITESLSNKVVKFQGDGTRQSPKAKAV